MTDTGRVENGRLLYESSEVPLGPSFPHKLIPLAKIRSSTGLQPSGHGDSYGEATFMIHPALLDAARTSAPEPPPHTIVDSWHALVAIRNKKCK